MYCEPVLFFEKKRKKRSNFSCAFCRSTHPCSKYIHEYYHLVFDDASRPFKKKRKKSYIGQHSVWITTNRKWQRGERDRKRKTEQQTKEREENWDCVVVAVLLTYIHTRICACVFVSKFCIKKIEIETFRIYWHDQLISTIWTRSFLAFLLFFFPIYTPSAILLQNYSFLFILVVLYFFLVLPFVQNW